MTAEETKLPKKRGKKNFVVDYEKAEALASKGLTNEQICRCLGISETTFYAKMQKDVKFQDIIKKGQAKGIAVIANALFENAKAGNVTAQIFFLKARAHWKDTHTLDIQTTSLSLAKIDHTITDPLEAAKMYAKYIRGEQ